MKLDEYYESVENDCNAELKNIKDELLENGAEKTIENNKITPEEIIASVAVNEAVESGHINIKSIKTEHQGVIAASLACITALFIDFYSGLIEHKELHERLNQALETVFNYSLVAGEILITSKFKLPSLLITLGSNIAKEMISQHTSKLTEKIVNKISQKNKVTENK